MPNPTYEEVRTNPAYRRIPDDELRQLYNKKFTAPQPEWTQQPTIKGRLLHLATDPMLLKGLGTAVGLALAPEGMIPAMAMSAAGSAGGGMASHIARKEGESVGQLGIDALEGATAPLGGHALQGTARVLRAVGRYTPNRAIFYSAFGGPKTLAAMAALKAATAESGLPRLLDFVGENYTKGINKLQGIAWRGATAAEEAAPVSTSTAESLSPRDLARIRQITGQSREVPYRMPSGAESPYKPGPFPAHRVNRVSPENAIRPEELQPRTLEEAYRLEGFEPPSSSSMQSLSRTVENPVNRGLTPQATERLSNVHSGGWQDVPLETTPARPPADFIHPADTSGAKFGFEHLPPISESELSRMQALFRRVVGK